MKKYLLLIVFFVQICMLNAQTEVEVVNQTGMQALDSNFVKWQAALIKDSIKSSESDANIKVFWADKLVKYSSQYSKNEGSAKQVLGKPNAFPTGGVAYTAWSVKEKDGIEKDKKASIRVGFTTPAIVRQVVIAESNAPGSVTQVTIFGVSGELKVVYEGAVQNIKEKARLFHVFLQEPSDFYVKEVEVKMDPISISGVNQIDAIGISDSKDSAYFGINVIPSLVFSNKPENLGDNVNTVYDEQAPMISPDGKTLYFVRKKHPENSGGFNDEDDIWYSTLGELKKWSPAKNIGSPLNTKNNNFVQSITPDGNTLLLGNVYNKDGSVEAGVSMTYKTKTGWAFPEKQVIDNFINLNQFANYFLSNDGRFLIMAIEMSDSHGELDLYVSQRKADNRWSKPINLGPVINTVVNDYSPFLAADGTTLYFSSAGHAGYGKEDIFVTSRLDDTWQNWSEPLNLGPMLNSPLTDSKYNIPASGEYAYLASVNNSKGKSDLFRIKLPQKAKPKPVVLIFGKVINDKTNQPIDARIIVEELPSGVEAAIARTDPNTGEFKIILPAGKKYGFRAIGLGFFDINKNIDLSGITEYTEIEDEILRLSPIEVGTVVRLNNIFFEFGKATLLPESYPELDRTAEFLTNNPTIQIEVSGHTDNVGSEGFNQRLSQSRAQSVADYIASKGIPKTRMTVMGYGMARPVAFNTDEEGRAMNRRVEFKIMKMGKN